jgi:hypothetical protein
MMPAMMREARNCSRPPPMPATKPNAADSARSPIIRLLALDRSAGRSAWAVAHSAVDLLADERPASSTPSTRRLGPREGVVSAGCLHRTGAPSRRASSSARRSGPRSARHASSTSSVAAQALPAADASRQRRWWSGIEGDGQDQAPRPSGSGRARRSGSRAWPLPGSRPARIRTSSRREAIRRSSSTSGKFMTSSLGDSRYSGPTPITIQSRFLGLVALMWPIAQGTKEALIYSKPGIMLRSYFALLP